MRLLFIGDIFAKPGRRAVKDLLPVIKEQHSVDFTVANGENAAGGFGLSGDIAQELLSYGIDVITSGNHIWNSNDIAEYLKKTNRVLRPLNYPPESPGLGFCTIPWGNIKISVINAMGRVFMSNLDCPFRRIEEALEGLKGSATVIVVDIHAEATSEKKAMGYFLDGKVSLVAGTHTHVQTADETILPRGTAYITDVGMTGSFDSVIGVEKDIIIHRFYTQLPKKFEPAKNDIRLNSVLVEVDEKTGRALDIKRVNMKLSE